MSDDKKTIDFKKLRPSLLRKSKSDNSGSKGTVHSLGKVPPPPKKKYDAKVLDGLEKLRKQREQEVKEINEMKRAMESEEYMARVIQVAHEVYVKAQPHLLRSEEERLALAESSIQAGQAFYRIAKEFIEYVATEDFINNIISSDDKPKA
jgi:hypothetical protein